MVNNRSLIKVLMAVELFILVEILSNSHICNRPYPTLRFYALPVPYVDNVSAASSILSNLSNLVFSLLGSIDFASLDNDCTFETS